MLYKYSLQKYDEKNLNNNFKKQLEMFFCSFNRNSISFLRNLKYNLPST
jgi:hypothetical protein